MSAPVKFKCAIVTGGAGGLGRAIAEYLIKGGKKVILVGRTESSLKKTEKEIGATAHYVLDTGDVDSDAIPKFISKVTQDHPEVDCLINNAGVQYPLFTSTTDASTFVAKGASEININIRGPMSLALHLLPHLKTKSSGCIMNVTSGLAYIPAKASCPVYCATKAFMHSFTMNLRSQLELDEKTKHIAVLEIVPPLVTTDLHRDAADPNDNTKEKNPIAMSIEEFMADFAEGFEGGKTTIPAGPAKMGVGAWFKTFGGIYDERVSLN